MTIETLEKRIEGKYKAISQLKKKIERIEAAKATNWEKNPYYYSERDLIDAQKDLNAEEDALGRYILQLEHEKEKAGSRNVKVLVDFLETWKESSIKFFKEEKSRYDVAMVEYRAKDKEFVDKFNGRSRLGLSREEVKQLEADHRQFKKEFRDTWLHVTQFFHGDRTWEENLERDIEIEKNRKYDDIIERTNALVGKITDASNLKVGAKGDLNGFIIGERGKAKVETISAEGPIQRFHFRTLIHAMS